MERKASILYDRDDRDLSQTRSPPTSTQTLPERRGTDILFWKQSHWLYFPDLKLVDKNVFVFGDQQWFLIVSWKVQEETALVKGRHSATIHLSRWFWEFSDWVTEALMYGTELWPLCTLFLQALGQNQSSISGETHSCLCPCQAGCTGLSGRQVSGQVPHNLYKGVNLLPTTLPNIKPGLN